MPSAHKLGKLSSRWSLKARMQRVVRRPSSCLTQSITHEVQYAASSRRHHPLCRHLRLALAQHIEKQEFWTLGSVHADALQCPIANNISLTEFIPAIVKWAVGLGHRLQCTRVGKSALESGLPQPSRYSVGVHDHVQGAAAGASVLPTGSSHSQRSLIGIIKRLKCLVVDRRSAPDPA